MKFKDLQLPISEVVPEVQARLREHSTLILQAPPGAGKSTLLPLEIMDEPWLQGKKILMLEPRRLAARSVAVRMAELLGQKVGERIGYRVRFDATVSAQTQVEVVTEGILTRMIQSDNALEEVGLVIFDEFHERSIHADLGLVLCREIQEVLREDLRIVIMSATLNLQDLERMLPAVPLVKSAGRQHPIQYHYFPASARSHLVDHTVKAVRRALEEQEGDILVFLPGTGEIRRAAEKLKGRLTEDVQVFPLFGDLSQADQRRAIAPAVSGERKVVLATSIAETSLTIQGIRTVVDSGKARVPRFDARSGMSRLETVDVSRDAADQRAGRAGRLGPGVCYRLWEKARHQYLPAYRSPEILDADLSPTVLELAEWGVSDMEELDWPSTPPPAAVAQAVDLLHGLGALENGKITTWGKRLLGFPAHPRMAHLLLKSKDIQASSLAADVAAVLDERDPLGWEAGADICLRLDALRDHRQKSRGRGDAKVLSRIERVSKLWRSRLKCEPLKSDPDPFLVGQLLAEAFPERVACKMDADKARYRMFNSRAAFLKREDPLSDWEWVAVAQVDATIDRGRIFLGAPFDPESLKHRMETVEVVRWDEEKGQLLARRERKLGSLLVGHQRMKQVAPELKAAALRAAVLKTPKLLPWEKGAEQWQARVMSLQKWRPKENWPNVSQAQLMAQIDDWLSPFLGGIQKSVDFEGLDLIGLLSVLLPWELGQRLDQLAPSHFQVPSGSKIRIQYFEDGRVPILAVRLQEVFGLFETPSVNQGQTKVMVHLLSPAYRPVQVTQDLRSFWENTYGEVRKELRGRYLKHYWPEDPFNAEAIRGSKKRKK